MQLGLFWEDLRKGMYAPQGETGFVNNVGSFFLVGWFGLFVFLFSFQGRGLC